MRKLTVILFTAALFAERLPQTAPLELIDAFDSAIQERLLKPAPKTLGMSRVMIRPSFGHHFNPDVSDKRDFAPENDGERRLIAEMERRGLQLGVYLFGDSVRESDIQLRSFRALKGPGAITLGTPRPAWYPGLEAAAVGSSDRLPDWNRVYPLAKEAMSAFAAGAEGFERELDGWTIAARPALANDARCVHCHNASMPDKFKVGDALGGVLYAFR